MTTEVQPTPPPQQPAPPVIDTARIAEEAARAATQAAEKIMDQKVAEVAAQTRRDIARSIDGEKPVAPQTQFLEHFATDPARAFHTLKEITKREMREEDAAKQGIVDTQRAVVSPFVNEYPELNSPKRLAAVEKFAEQYEKAGMSYGEALQKGCEDAVKEFGCKSVSDAQRENGYRAGLPGGGGSTSSGAQPYNENASNQSFLEGMQSRMKGFRTKAPIK